MDFITITDIARIAGVSKTTVSRVLNNPSIVDSSTCRKVEKVIEDFHYVPSAAARSLSKSSSTTIGAVVADIANPFLSELLKGILKICHKEGYTLICSDNSDNMENDFRALNTMKEQRVAGLIYAPAVDYSYYSKTEQLKRMIKDLHAPVVLVDRKVCWDEIPFDGVFFNDYEAIKESVRTLAAHGHKRIALINSNEKNVLTDNRLKGYLDGLHESGLETDRELVYANGTYTIESSYKQTCEMLCSKNIPTAVITCNNHLSQGFLKAVYESKVDEAKHICFIGLDSLEMMGILGIKYNYIDRDSFLMGQKAAEQLFRRIQQPFDERYELVLDAPLILQTF